MGRVVHFEIGADDPARAIRFYEDAFGWEIKKWEGPLEYWLVMTGPKEEPGIDGAIMKRNSLKELFPTAKLKKTDEALMNRFVPRGYGTINTIDVENAKQSLTKIISAGGKQATELETVPGVGQFCYCEDTEGNIFGIMQWDPHSK
jgi:predicted enzyme related to lactoylglutathione lyase